jgi:hypothetical protein
MGSVYSCPMTQIVLALRATRATASTTTLAVTVTGAWGFVLVIAVGFGRCTGRCAVSAASCVRLGATARAVAVAALVPRATLAIA